MIVYISRTKNVPLKMSNIQQYRNCRRLHCKKCQSKEFMHKQKHVDLIYDISWSFLLEYFLVFTCNISGYPIKKYLSKYVLSGFISQQYNVIECNLVKMQKVTFAKQVNKSKFAFCKNIIFNMLHNILCTLSCLIIIHHIFHLHSFYFLTAYSLKAFWSKIIFDRPMSEKEY